MKKYVNILLAAVEIGRLYGGDWMFIPWCAASGKDIEFTPSDKGIDEQPDFEIDTLYELMN